MRVFICYARVDQAFALPLAEQLEARGVAVWVDQEQNKVSDDWDRDIDRALRDCSHLLIVLSPASVDSREVRGELRTALDLGKPVLPVLYKPCEIPRQLRIVQFVDFTGRSPKDASRLNEVLRALSPPLDGADPAPLGPVAPAPASPRPATTRFRLDALGVRTKAALACALVVLLSAGAWFGLDTATSERRMFRDAALSPDGAYLATANYSGRGAVRVWDVTSGREAAFIPTDGAAMVCAWSPDGKKLAIGSFAGAITVYDTGSWTRSNELKGPSELIQSVTWSPDSAAIATGDSQGSLWVWNLAPPAVRFTKPIHMQRIEAVAWSPDGTRLATASWDHSVAIVNARDGRVEKRLEGHASFVKVVAFSPDGQLLASGSLEAPYLILWDQAGNRHDLMGPRGEVGRVQWSSDGRYLASIGKDNLVHVWDPHRFELVRRFTLSGSYISGTSLAWSPDGARIAAGDSKGIQILDPRRDVPVQTLVDPVDATFDNVELAGWSADGTRLGAFVSFERIARVWDVAKASRLQSFSVGLWQALTE